MAADTGGAKEFRAHEDTYRFFTGLMKWGTVISFVVAAIVVLVIAS